MDMETSLRRRSIHGRLALKKEDIDQKKAESSSGDDHDGYSDDQEIDHNNEGSLKPKMEIVTPEIFNSNASPSAQKEQDDLLKSTKAEMGEVIEENQRLKMYLDRVMKDYRVLQMQFHEIVQQDQPNKSSSTVTATSTHQEAEEPEFVSLSLGRSTSIDGKKLDDIACNYKNNITNGKEKIGDHHDEDEYKEGLDLALDCKFELPKNNNNNNDIIINARSTQHSPNPSLEMNSDEAKEEAGETWPAQKSLKNGRNGEDEISQQNPTKRARVSVRVRCDTPTMNDGCQWRKYGQKIAKGNPCPRAYYRCTVAPNCPVRKQVQRCAEDMSILITTYEGTHNHPLPISATAMASTTSAAASMLLSGSTTSGSGSGPTLSATATSFASTATLNGLNFYLSDNSKPKPFFVPNSSFSSSPSFPTITLDLTTNPSAASHLNKLGSSSSTFPPRYSTTNLNFSSLQESNSLPISWSSTNGVPNYGNRFQTNSLAFGSSRQYSQETGLYQNYLQKHNILSSSTHHQNLPSSSDTIAAATKAITSDPSFQSALAAALTSIIGGSGNVNVSTTAGGGALAADKISTAQNMKAMIESFPVLSSFQSSSSPPNANKCASSFLNSSKPPSSPANSHQPGNLMFLSPSSLPFSTPNSNAATSQAGDKRDHIS